MRFIFGSVNFSSDKEDKGLLDSVKSAIVLFLCKMRLLSVTFRGMLLYHMRGIL